MLSSLLTMLVLATTTDATDATVRIDTTIAVAQGTSLELNNFAGDISVTAWSKNAVRVLAERGRRDRIVIGMREKTLVIGSFNLRGGPSAVEYTLSVPTWMPLQITGVDSEISVEGVKAAVHASSVKGDVRVRGGGGAVEASSIEGSVVVRDSDGPLTVSTVNNDLTLERVSGTVDAQSINGSIRLAEIVGRSVDASSVNGIVRFTGAFRPQGRYRFASHNGNLLVGVPQNAGLDVSVATFNGEFESQLPVVLGPRQKGKRFNFTLGQGGASLELESFQGLIQLVRDGSPELLEMAPTPTPATRVRPRSRMHWIPSVAPVPESPKKAPKPPKAPKAGDQTDEDDDHEEEAP